MLVLCTAPDPEVAADLARKLVDAELAACVNILPQIRSFYRWQGEVHDDAEVQLLIKTRESRFGALEEKLRAEHPYDVPEVIALPIVAGSEPYLEWLVAQTGG